MLRARTVSRSGFAPIGFGECKGRIVAAHSSSVSRGERDREATG
jgi:hypothetical protein